MRFRLVFKYFFTLERASSTPGERVKKGETHYSGLGRRRAAINHENHASRGIANSAHVVTRLRELGAARKPT